MLPWGVAGVMTLATVVLALLSFRSPSAPQASAIRFSIPIPASDQFLAPPVSVSPDGTRVAYMGVNSAGDPQILIRALDSPQGQPLAGTEGAGPLIFWSPDSQFLGFVADGSLKKIPAAGGPVQTLASPAFPRGGSWSRNGVILFTPTNAGGLSKVSDRGGTVTPATTMDTDSGERNNRWPSFLPDGEHFLYLVGTSQAENSGIYIGSLNSDEKQFLLNTRWKAEYAAPGYLLFADEDRLMAQPFDPDGLELTGEATLVAEGLDFAPQGTGDASFSVSDGGVLAHWSGGQNAQNRLIWYDRTGEELGTVGQPGEISNQKVSPDGNQVAYEVSPDGNLDIWLLDLSRNVTSRFTSDASVERHPLWSPDGTRIVFHSNRDTGIYDIYERPASGAGSAQLLYQSDVRKYPRDWSADGQFLAFTTYGVGEGSNNDLWILPMSGDREPFPYLATQFHETQGQFSPDGNWMAYVSDESGRAEVYISAFPEPGRPVRVSTDGGVQPHWRRDGRELFYVSLDRTMMAAPISTGEVGSPVELFATSMALNYSTPSSSFFYDVSADGQRFLLTVIPESNVPITVVLNWTNELVR